jgi:hypothetical protein
VRTKGEVRRGRTAAWFAALAMAAAPLAGVLLATLAVAALAGTGIAGAATPDLVVGPGSGFRTREPAMLRPLREDVTILPILTVGDTLAPSGPDQAPYAFYPLPDGLGVRKISSSIAEAYVAHELTWHSDYGGARVSRLALDLRNLGVLAGDYLIDGSEGYSRFCAASLVGTREGFLAPTFLLNEESLDGVRHGLVLALDTRDAIVTPLPWLGHFSHEATVIVPVSSSKIVAILTEDWVPGQSQLYMYIADTDADFLAGRGQLHVFRADAPLGRRNTGLASMASKLHPLTGRFVPVTTPAGTAESRLPDLLEQRAQAAGCLNFARLEDAAPDRDRTNAFYFVDTGAADWTDPETGRLITGSGRVYRAMLDPFDPTRVQELAVVLDGDDGDDIFRPDNIDDDERYLMIQEDPGGGRGLRTARVLRYDRQTRMLDALAECAERDAQGRELGAGIGGTWESSGIVDVSEIFGPDSWLLAVQAPNIRIQNFPVRGGSGQLLLMRGPRYPRAQIQSPKPLKEKKSKKFAQPDSTR